MKELFEKHYQAIINRGLINQDTEIFDFFSKLMEKQQELANAVFDNDKNQINQEAIDLMMVAVNLCRWLKVDIEKELIKNIKIQEKRANENENK